MEDLDDSVLNNIDSVLSANDSIVNISSQTIDYIDLTKESPLSARPSRSRQRNAEDIPPNHNITDSSDHHRRRALSPIVLGIQHTYKKKSRKEGKVTHSTSTAEILVLDDTIEENDEPSYTIESDDKKPIPLTCPICFESLSSNSRPITTRCGHVFCTECLNTYFRGAKKCPTCKSTITLKSCTRLYL